MGTRNGRRKKAVIQHESVAIPVSQQTVAVKVVEKSEHVPEQQDLQTVAALLAHVINAEGVPGRVLEKAVHALADLPPWLSPLNGLLGLSVKNSLGLLDAMPAMRFFRAARPAAPETQKVSQVEKIRIK